MLEQDTVAEEILNMVKAHPGCTLDELTERLPRWNWSEVFIEVDRLSRLGRLQLTQSGAGFITTLHPL
ncbi:hypothetical protein ACO9S2_05620 [Nitrospira sp. NS4]|uniref:hypothetical protein n=1 Tax=Nitrospira sp. NS4 TaxID=3414498 RepID=UPI003C2C7139